MAARKASKTIRKVAPKGGAVRTRAVDRVRRVKKGSDMLASIHEAVSDLHEIGLADTKTMREFDRLCLEPVRAFRPAEIAALRKRERVSQPVFAAYLNVSKSSVSQWETGEKKPDGPALKLLNIVERKGLAALA
jgi:putative transcriptional regulator